MYRLFVHSTALLALFATFAQADPVVTFMLSSPQNGHTLAPGAPIAWTITAEASAGDNSGLALVACDLVQNPTNPAFFDLPPASGVPAGLENLSRPLGLSNPGEGGAGTGYIGVQRSPIGQIYKNLVQIGGGQNTFGAAMPSGSGFCESADVVAGIGQCTPVVIAAGSFTAPTVAGTYELHLSSGIANVLSQLSPPPEPPTFWPVSAATVAGLPSASVGFLVSTELLGDMNCDGLVNTDDIPHFVQALVDPTGYVAHHDGDPYLACQLRRGDLNHDKREDGIDIQFFVSLLLGQ